MSSKSFRRNPFWPMVVAVLEEEGYHTYRPEQTKTMLSVVITTVRSGAVVEREYKMPQGAYLHCTTLNFKSRFRNYVRGDLRDKGFTPPGATPVSIQKTVLEKRQIPAPATPKLDTSALARAIFGTKAPEPPDAPVNGHHEPPPSPPPVVAAPQPPQQSTPAPERSSDDMMAVLLAIHQDDLQMVLEATRGVAKLIRARPLSDLPQAKVAAPPPAPPRPVLTVTAPPTVVPVDAPQPNVEQGGDDPSYVPGRSLPEKILTLMRSKPNRTWDVADVATHIPGYDRSYFPIALSNLCHKRRVQRLARGVYALPNNR